MNSTGYGRPTSAPSISLKLIVTAVAVFQFLSVNAAEAVGIVRGPYLQTVTPDSVIVKWRTDASTDAQVKFGSSSTALSQSAYSSSNGTDHEVKLTGLSPSTRYYYSVGSSSETIAGDSSFRFVTAPAENSKEATRVWVLGDPGTNSHGSSGVRDGFKKLAGSSPTNLILMLGDNAYQDGKDDEYQDAIFDVYPELLRQTPVYSTFGNHDGHTARSSDESGVYYDIFSFPRNAEAGGVATGTEAYFSFDYGNVHYINLNSADVDDDVDGPMMTWLESDLAATDKDFIVAFWHHPPYSKGSHDSDDSGSQTAMRENALPLLEKYGTDLVLSGHSHGYERSFLIDGHYGYSSTFDNSMILDGGNGREDGTGVYSKTPKLVNQGTTYMVMGVSGRTSSSGSLDHPAMLVNKRELGSVVLDVADNRMDVSFIGTEGETIDQFSISKGSDLTPPAIVDADAHANTSVRLEFSEAVNESSAESLRNYIISMRGETGPVADIEVLSASLSADGRTVILGTTPLQKDVVYKVAAQNISDRYDNVAEATVEIVVADVEPPTNIATVIPASYALWVGWTPPSSDDIAGYHVWLNGDDMGVVAEPEYKARELESNTDYIFAVASVDPVGNESVKVFFQESTLSQQSLADGRWGESTIERELLAATHAVVSFAITAAVAADEPAGKGGAKGAKSWKKSGAEKERFAATAVQDIRTLGKSSDSIWIGWSEPSVITGVVGYRVRLNKADMGVVSSMEFQAADLEPSTSYKFEIAPVDSSGRAVSNARYTETTLTEAGSGAEPTAPSEPTEPTEPTEPSEPTEPTAPTEINTVPTISGSPDVSAQVDTPYSFQPVATDADGGPSPLSFSISNKPGWATFAADTGRLSGTPSGVGTTANVLISVSDGAARASLAAFDLTVTAAVAESPGSEGNVKFFVDVNHANASDSNPGTESEPWKSVIHAGEVAKAGDTVLIKAGFYQGGGEDVNVRNSGEEGREIVFSAYPGDERKVVLETSTFNIKSKSYIQVRGLKIQNTDGRGIYVQGPDDAYAPAVSNITISGNHTYNTHSSGISVWGVRYGLDPGDYEGVVDIVIENNLLEKAVNGGSNECITLSHGVVRADVRGNELRDGGDRSNGGEGIDFKNGVRDSYIRNNYIHGLTRRGIYVDGGRAEGAVTSNIHIYGNVVMDDPDSAIYIMSEGVGDVDGIYIYNNLVLGADRNGIGIWEHSGGAGISTINDIQIINNTVIDTGRAGSGWGGISIKHDDATNVLVRNNIVLEGNGFDIAGNSYTTIDHNFCRNGVCELQGDPRFVNPTFDPATMDYRLKSDSAAIDEGSSEGAPLFDHDALPRPQGSAIDLGAYEYAF